MAERVLAELKAELLERSARVPLAGWQRFFPDFQVPIGTHMTSPLLPADRSHIIDGRGKPLAAPHTIGHDVVLQTFLDREGRVLEKLVRYTSDGYDSDKRGLDEVLGETSEERYRWAHPIVLEKLDWLERRASELPPAEQAV